MSVTIRETKDSRAFDLNDRSGRSPFRYLAFVTGESNPEYALYAALLADLTLAPYFWNGLARGKPAADPLGGGWYDVTLPYALPQGLPATDPAAITPAGGQSPAPPPPPPRPEENIPPGTTLKIGGKPPRIYRSFRTVESQIVDYLDLVGFSPSDFKQAIHVDKDGKVEGVEMPDPSSVLTMNRVFTYLTWKWVLRLEQCCWHPNFQQWGPFPPGVAMLVGAHLEVQKDGKVQVAFDLGLDAGEGPIDVRGDGDLVISKRPPWHYVWAVYEHEKDSGSGRLVTRPVMAYCEQLAAEKDYNTLGLF